MNSRYLSCEVSVSKRVQKLIECLLIELIVFGILNFLWISHLHGGNRNQLSVLFISPYSLQSDHKYQKGDVLSMKQQAIVTPDLPIWALSHWLVPNPNISL